MDIVIYQQDGAASYCSNASLEYFNRYFPGDRLISHHKRARPMYRHTDIYRPI